MLCRLLLPYFSRWVECETGTLQKDTAALRAARGTPGTCLCALRLAVAKSQATRKRIVSARARLLGLRNLALAEVIPFPDTSQPATRVDERASSTGAYPRGQHQPRRPLNRRPPRPRTHRPVGIRRNLGGPARGGGADRQGPRYGARRRNDAEA